VAVGLEETEEFLAQSQDLRLAWSKQGIPITELAVPNGNHFSILDHLLPNGAIHQAVLTQMGVASS
jgi:hypothetical protein